MLRASQLRLQAADFRLEEDNRPQQIARLGDAEQVPLEIAMLLDVSGSVNARFSLKKKPPCAQTDSKARRPRLRLCHRRPTAP
jgi:hypothetical protein